MRNHRHCAQENVYTRVKWDMCPGRPCRPYLIFYAACDIQTGTEIILDYGPQYWQVMAKQLGRAHADEWFEADRQCTHLQTVLREAGVREAKIEACLKVDLNNEVIYTV